MTYIDSDNQAVKKLFRWRPVREEVEIVDKTQTDSDGSWRESRWFKLRRLEVGRLYKLKE